MGKTDSTLIAIGGGEFSDADDVTREIVVPLKKAAGSRLLVMTIATREPLKAAKKYTKIFSDLGVKHIDTVDISQRCDAFDEESVEKVQKADALFFTGGDQLNVTSLMGGSAVHDILRERLRTGFLVAGTSAGAAMMSNSMIISGHSDSSPKVGAVEMAPGMDLLRGTIIDTHFSQRGRFGRLLTAIAHYPADIGIGIDEGTGIVIKGRHLRVVGKGAVTVMDGSKMKHNDLPYRDDDETVGMFDVCVHVLPAGYRFDLDTRKPSAPQLKALAGSANGG